MKVLVCENKENENSKSKEESIVQSKDVICPKFGENCMVKIENYRFDLINCVNGHSLKNIYLDGFKNI